MHEEEVLLISCYNGFYFVYKDRRKLMSKWSFHLDDFFCIGSDICILIPHRREHYRVENDQY